MIFLIFFLSGISGLIYQIVWVREFGLIFGNTVYSAALVTGVFVFNLGIGSFLAGRYIDRKNSNNSLFGLKAYMYAEVIIAFLGLVLAFAIPQLEILSPYISSYTQNEQGWNVLSTSSYSLRYFLAVILLSAPTLVMGATLTFLVRYLLRSSTESSGWKIGLLYGFNTLGAGFGCLFVDLMFIPNVGLYATKFVAILLNLIAAYLSLKVLKTHGETKEPDTPSSQPKPSLISLADLKPNAACLAIFVSGFAAMGLEIIWFRYLITVLEAHRIIFSLILFTMLVGMWAGSLLCGKILNKYKPKIVYVLSQTLVPVTSLLCLILFIHMDKNWPFPILQNYFATAMDFDWDLAQLILFWPVPIVVLLPAIFMGFAFPAVNALIQDDVKKVGQTTGQIYIWNSLGALLGSLTSGFILIPFLGIQTGIFILASISILAIVPIFIRYYSKNNFKAASLFFKGSMATNLAVFAVLMGIWVNLQPFQFLFSGVKINADDNETKVLSVSEGVLESIVITEGVNQSDGKIYRRLVTNGHSMSATTPGALRYMRAFSHIPLLQQENPTSVLVICFGVGSTIHAASLHPTIEQIDQVDLSKHVLSHASFFEPWNKNILKDPRVNVYVNDGRQHLRMVNENQYDLVTLEPPPIRFAGVSSLYSVEFYELAKRALKPGGYVTQWWPIYQLENPHSRALVKAFIDVFPNAILLNGANKDFILVGKKGENNVIDPEFIQSQILKRPKVAEDLKFIDMDNITEFIGTFVADSAILQEVTKHDLPLSNDFPLSEYSDYLPKEILDNRFYRPDRVREWCPKCFESSSEASAKATIENLMPYLAMRFQIYNSVDFRYENVPHPKSKVQKPSSKIVIPLETALQMVETYPYLKRIAGIQRAKPKDDPSEKAKNQKSTE